MGERSGGGAIQPGGGGDLRDPESRSDPLPGDHAHDEQVWQDSGRGDRKWKGQKDRKSTRLNSSHVKISYAVFCLKKKKKKKKKKMQVIEKKRYIQKYI